MRELDAEPTGQPNAPPPVEVTAALVRAHQAGLWRYLRVLGADADEAADLAQEAFVVLLRTPLQDRGDGAMRAWLRATARHLLLAAWRAKRRSPLALDADALERAWASYERDDDGAGYRAALARCLELLPAAQRDALERAADGRRAGGAGAVAEAERSRLRRWKQALRDCVRRRLHDDD